MSDDHTHIVSGSGQEAAEAALLKMQETGMGGFLFLVTHDKQVGIIALQKIHKMSLSQAKLFRQSVDKVIAELEKLQ